jgi:hypothetical protein
MSASISAYALESDACGVVYFVGSGVMLGSAKIGPLATFPEGGCCEGVLAGGVACFVRRVLAPVFVEWDFVCRFRAAVMTDLLVQMGPDTLAIAIPCCTINFLEIGQKRH